MVQNGRSSDSSWAKSIWSYFGSNSMRKAIWEKPVEERLGEGFQLGMHLRTPWNKDYLFFSVYVDDIIFAWKETKYWSDVEFTQKRSRFGRTNIFPWSCCLGLYSKTMWISKDNIDNYRTMFESRISAGALEKIPKTKVSWKPDAETLLLHGPWYGKLCRKCLERDCELANKTTQSHKVATPCLNDHQCKEELGSVGG